MVTLIIMPIQILDKIKIFKKVYKEMDKKISLFSQLTSQIERKVGELKVKF